MEEGRDHDLRRSKKRKSMEDETRNIEGSEDEKVEEFFALIRSTREVCRRLQSSSKDRHDHGDGGRGNQVGATEETDRSGVWNPTFRPEDFLDDHREDRRDREDRALHLGGTSRSQSKVEEEETVKEDKRSAVGDTNTNINDNTNLDLKLSL